MRRLRRLVEEFLHVLRAVPAPCSGSLPSIHATVHGSFQTNFTAFSYEKADSNPEVDPLALPGAVRTRKPGQYFLSCVTRVFSPFFRAFPHSVQLDVESRRFSDLSPR